MEQTAADTFAQFFAQYGPLGLFLLAFLCLFGIFLWLTLRVSKEWRQDNTGRITEQAAKILALEVERDEWRDKYFTYKGMDVGALDGDGNPIRAEVGDIQ